MHKANDVIGLPVLNLESGHECGIVRDVLFDEDWTFQGLLVEVKALFRKSRFVASDEIHAIGEDYVVLANEEVMLPAQDVENYHGVKTGPVTMIGKPVITSNGQRLGQVEDIYFQTEFGEIVGYEISDGIISDILDGRKAVKHVISTKIGEDALILPLTVPPLLETEKEDNNE